MSIAAMVANMTEKIDDPIEVFKNYHKEKITAIVDNHLAQKFGSAVCEVAIQKYLNSSGISHEFCIKTDIQGNDNNNGRYAVLRINRISEHAEMVFYRVYIT